MSEPYIGNKSSLFSEFPVCPGIKYSVVIPVKNEANYITNTLTALALQNDINGEKLNPKLFEILVLANNCSDNSVELIQKFQLIHPELNLYLVEIKLPKKSANIGFVRRMLMESAYLRLSSNNGGLILTTDGDTTVANDWIAQTQMEIVKGADVVGGRILLYENEIEDLDLLTRLHHFKDEKYNLLIAELEGIILNPDFDAAPRHHQHFNGSFAITTECYAKSGGVPVVEYLEDCAFFDRLQLIDAKIRHSYNVKVHTSARCAGRTAIGLSQQLNVWQSLGENIKEYQVESSVSITERLHKKRSLMDLWHLKRGLTEPDFHSILISIFPDTVFDDQAFAYFKSCNYFGEWYHHLMGITLIEHQNGLETDTIDMAIEKLQEMINDYSDARFSQTSIR
jgi:glycosyltransferase involved in cell wall biosynthesis